MWKDLEEKYTELLIKKQWNFDKNRTIWILFCGILKYRKIFLRKHSVNCTLRLRIPESKLKHSKNIFTSSLSYIYCQLGLCKDQESAKWKMKKKLFGLFYTIMFISIICSMTLCRLSSYFVSLNKYWIHTLLLWAK